MTLGDRIKKIRLAKGISQRQLAADLYSRSYISQIERNLIEPSKEVLIHFSQEFEMSLQALTGEKADVSDEKNDFVWEQIQASIDAYMNGKYQESLNVLDLIFSEIVTSNKSAHLFCMNLMFKNLLQLGLHNRFHYLIETFNQTMGPLTDYERSLKNGILISILEFEFLSNNFDEAMSVYDKLQIEIKFGHITADNGLLVCYRIAQAVASIRGDSQLVDQMFEKTAELTKHMKKLTPCYLKAQLDCIGLGQEEGDVENIISDVNTIIQNGNILGDFTSVAMGKMRLCEILLYFEKYTFLKEALNSYHTTLSKNEGHLYYKNNMVNYLILTSSYHMALKEYTLAKKALERGISIIEKSKFGVSVLSKTDLLLQCSNLYYSLGNKASGDLYLYMSKEVIIDDQIRSRFTQVSDISKKYSGMSC